ncbi:hypothetical protein [Rhodoferax fermentans]|uniref:VCBS repeat-containing protein n=1 Tax=Rhodoferax fermentans TaxID=28066 RepID=A0A1T1AQ10_RHOFE|nr:hypothetical protein [Rhodoferax fermentans]MBK1682437.1 hypothetical protein [Rhodoferax fermentans]OOV06196.1 hypothetical protein RF819_05160 [Rhodoferax fermentans]
MKITESAVALQSQHSNLSWRSTQTRLRAWVGQAPSPRSLERDVQHTPAVRVTLSDGARQKLLQQAQAQAVPAGEAVSDGDIQSLASRLRVLMDMVKAITGREVTVFDARDLQAQTSTQVSPPPAAASSSQAATAPQAAGWGLEMDASEHIVEAESTQVSAQGVVKTADGQTIQFSLQLAMSRSFVQDSRLSIRAGDAVRQDPLVINFDGTGAQLTDAQFAFDLNADGQTENIAFVAGGSGFLVLDKNKDGQVNNGTELFGPSSGDGFADLAQYDLDGNSWIDENDAVYSQLQVWQKNAEGQDSLTSLAQNGVGALYLGRVASPFFVNTASNQTLGQVRSTGVFLYESGAVGTLQQVDL